MISIHAIAKQEYLFLSFCAHHFCFINSKALVASSDLSNRIMSSVVPSHLFYTNAIYSKVLCMTYLSHLQ